MAKYECRLQGSFDRLLSEIDNGIVRGSISASFEDGSNYSSQNGIRVAVRVYERYSMTGSNRVSMNVTLTDDGNELFVSAITSGGSQATFFKINTFGEEAFLDKVVEIVEKYKRFVK